jgi:GxxExxY protein
MQDKQRDSHEGTKTRRKDKEELSRIVVDCAYKMHVEIGPGLLESVYEAVLEKLLLERGLKVTRQQSIPVEVMGLSINEGFRADLIVEGILLIELKSVEKLAPVHSKQVLTYLRLLNMPLGLLINFGAATFKEGCKRIVNGEQNFVTSCLRVNQKG